MTERLATWVWVGAAALACVAGIVNVVGYLGFEHQAITHLTGTTSLLGAAVAAGDVRAMGQLAAMLAALLAGGIAGALLFGQWQYRALYLPAWLTGMAGLVYGIYRHRQLVKGRITP